MRKIVTKAFLLLALSTLIVGCKSGKTSSIDDDPIPMEFDNAEDYVYENVSNENGSASYEIFVRSYYDSDGNGTGDLLGVKEKIPYLADLGIKTLWLMPIHPSPTYHGYDVMDYYNVKNDLGTLEDFDAMIATANQYNVDIILDMVFNHCSKYNPYFTQAQDDYRSSYSGEDSKKDWFTFYGSADSYEARFDSSMPDFNLDCQAVREEIENIMKFWINRGVKGFRLDAVLYYYYNDTTKNVSFMNWLEDTAHKYNPDFYMVGENWSSDALVNSYHKSKLDSFFRFGTAVGGENSLVNYMKGNGKARKLLSTIEQNEKVIKQNNPNSYASYFLSNHDQDRIGHNFDEMQNKCAASFYMLLPGTPFMYYGEEIGMLGKRKTSPDDYSDVRRRLPMVWSESDKTGQCVFPEKSRQDLAKNDQVEKGVNDRLSEPFSLLKHYKKVINLRNKYDFIKHGVFTSLYNELNTEETAAYAFKISLGEQFIVVVHNSSSHNIQVSAPANTIVEQINTSHRIPTLIDGTLTLGAYSTVIMQ